MIILLSFLLFSCTTPIRSIVNHPDRYHGKRVRVKGKVISSIQLDDLSMFTIKGYRYFVNVTTDSYLPVVNDKVKVRGKVDSKFYYQRDTILIIKEIISKRRIKKLNDNFDYKYINKKMLKDKK